MEDKNELQRDLGAAMDRLGEVLYRIRDYGTEQGRDVNSVIANIRMTVDARTCHREIKLTDTLVDPAVSRVLQEVEGSRD